jgi:hypothetical protein
MIKPISHVGLTGPLALLKKEGSILPLNYRPSLFLIAELENRNFCQLSKPGTLGRYTCLTPSQLADSLELMVSLSFILSPPHLGTRFPSRMEPLDECLQILPLHGSIIGEGI